MVIWLLDFFYNQNVQKLVLFTAIFYIKSNNDVSIVHCKFDIQKFVIGFIPDDEAII